MVNFHGRGRKWDPMDVFHREKMDALDVYNDEGKSAKCKMR
jgi:hypothetical protein